jgi:hypothetical protein
VRLPRTAGARRALLALLFLGGFLALAVAFGGSAHAEAKSASGSVSGAASGSVLSHLTKHKGAHSGAVSQLLGDAEQSERPERSRTPKDSSDSSDLTRVTRRDGDSVADLTRDERKVAGAAQSSDVTRLAQHATTSAAKAVTPVTCEAVHTGQVVRPVGKAVHGITGMVNLRGITGRLGLSGHSGGQAGQGAAPGAGVPAGGHTHTSPRDRAGAGKGEHARGTSRFTVHTAPYGGPAGQAVAERGDGHGGEGAPAPGSPFDHMPAALASSTTTSGSMGDAHGPRGGGPHQLAAFLTDMERFGPLQPGATHAADRTPTRERSRDVLEFPG